MTSEKILTAISVNSGLSSKLHLSEKRSGSGLRSGWGMTRWVVLLRFVGIGWYIAICIVGGGWLGLWLDGKFNSKPLLAFIGLAFGLLLAFFGVYHILRPTLHWGHDKNKGNE